MRNREQLLLKLDLWEEENIDIVKHVTINKSDAIGRLEESQPINSGEVIAVWRELNMFGYGDTQESAMNDLLDCLHEYNETLKKEERKSLGVVCLRDKEILNKFFNY